MNVVLEVMFVTFVLAACTTIDVHRAPPADWPVLEERIEVVGWVELQRLCTLNFMCTGTFWIRFDLGICTIYVLSLNDRYAIEHERKHCRGYDHPGSNLLSEGWQKWKSVRDTGSASRNTPPR